MKTKENYLVGYIIAVIGIVVMFIAGLCMSPLAAKAAESSDFRYSATSINITQNMVMTNSAGSVTRTETKQGSCALDGGAYCYILSYQYTEAQGGLKRYYLARYDYDTGNFITNIASLPSECLNVEKVENGVTTTSVSSNPSIAIGTLKADTGSWTQEYTSSINLPMFDTVEAATAFMTTGDESGNLNQTEIVDDNTLGLAGFTCDNSIKATWTDLVCDNPDSIVLEDVIVNVVPYYVSTDSNGQVVTQSPTDSTICVPYTDFSFEKAYNEYMAQNPYAGVTNLVLYFFPSYHDPETNTKYNGQRIRVTFDVLGNMDRINTSFGENIDEFVKVDSVTYPDNYVSQTGDINTQLEIPKIVMMNDASKYDGYGVDFWEDNLPYLFQIENASENLNIEVQGRWYTVDDIELYKENLMWKYRYNSLIKGELTTWLSYSDCQKSNTIFNFADIGSSASAWDKLLRQHPIDKRTYSGGTDAIGNFLSGYDDAYNTLTSVLLPYCESMYGGCEVYVRFWYEDEEGVHYSKWAHWFDDMATPSGSSGSQWDDSEAMFGESQSNNGLTDEDLETIEGTGNSKNDADVSHSFTSSPYDLDVEKVFGTLQSLFVSFGEFPNLFSRVFSFLPSWLTSLIYAAIGFVVLIGIVKAVK